MPRYRWTGVGRFDGDVAPGEVADLPERVGEPQPELERVEIPDPDGPDVESGTLPFAPGEHTVSELRDRVQDINDADALRALRTAEADGGDRTTALDAIDDRLAALGD
jgi:hypothetical protein